ncbi:MAG: hypothetical protein A2Y38_10195 [Spirochaetes bacterium GWB1_59_5]|nr:MAG: hypothetical protein A2Y38_10195 [Spirochaetes bacterium GWB1_59_5]
MNDQAQVHSVKPDDDDEINLLDLAATLLSYKKLILRLTVGAAVAAVLFSIGSLLLPREISYLPNLYTPRASMLVAQQSGGLSSMLSSSGLGGLASLAGISAGGSSNGELAVAIARSNTTVDELNDEFDFTARYKIKKSYKAETRKAFLEKFSASLDEKTGILSLSFEDIDPEFAMRVVNRTVEILDRRFMALGGSKAMDQKRLLETKLADVQSGMDGLQVKLQEFTTRYGVLSVEALATEQVTVMARLRAELIMKDIEIENYKKFSTIDDPVIRRLRSERDSIATALGEVESGKSGVLPSQKEIPALAFEFATIQRDLLVQTEIFKLITQQYELAKMSAEGQEPSFQILELAEVVDKKSGPSRGMICVVATMAAFFLAVLLAFVLEAVKNIKADPEAMARLKGNVR